MDRSWGIIIICEPVEKESTGHKKTGFFPGGKGNSSTGFIHINFPQEINIRPNILGRKIKCRQIHRTAFAVKSQISCYEMLKAQIHPVISLAGERPYYFD
jgi:hypothetical protein